MTKEKIKAFCEKIFAKNTKLKGDDSFFFQRGDGDWGWCVGTPLLLGDLTKEEAKELKTLLEPLVNLPELKLRQTFTYQFWIPKNQEIIENGRLNNTNSKSFIDNLSELIKELESIISGKEHDDPERERERAKMSDELPRVFPTVYFF